MRQTVKSTGPVPLVAAGIGAFAGGLCAAALCPPLALFGLIGGALAAYCGAKQDIKENVDPIGREEAGRIAREWERMRMPWEKSVQVSVSKGSNGALFDLPMTRQFTFTLDDED